MKTTNRSIGHEWINQTKQSEKASNIFFDGLSIYSYGYHFKMGEILPGNIVLWNSSTYSKTTSKHQSYVRRCIPDYFKVFTVPYITDHKNNIDHYINLINENLRKSVKARENKEWILRNAQSIISELSDYCQVFKIKPTKEVKKLLLLDLLDAETLQKIKDAENKRIQAAIKANKEKIQYWIEGKIDYIDRKVNKVFLRLNGDFVETSKYAKVSIDAAKILFKMIQAGKDIKGHNIDGFTVIGINGTLKIGCHTIERAEINRFAELMNWGQIEIH